MDIDQKDEITIFSVGLHIKNLSHQFLRADYFLERGLRMYSLVKQFITEKDLYRQVLLLEQLLNNSQVTVKELAEKIETTERTVFSDLNSVRSYLPSGWEIATDNNGIKLISEITVATNDIWEVFLPHSITLQLVKELLFTKELNLSDFLYNTGISMETLKRHTTKVNQKLKNYHIRIRLKGGTAQLVGEESSIRIFYHRLLLPFTHNNYFFEDYFIHEDHYQYFLVKDISTKLKVETEQIFGICWFFINTIRIKAGCQINQFSFNQKDPLLCLYVPSLKKLYKKEGIYLEESELFFAFFCFFESWNYNNEFGEEVKTVLNTDYPNLLEKAQETVQKLAEKLNLPKLHETHLKCNLLILLLKYAESPSLSEQFQLEYQELLIQQNEAYPIVQMIGEELFQELLKVASIKEQAYFVNIFLLLCQQAIFSIKTHTITIYLIFQSEPAWKLFLQQELSDYLGKRIRIEPIELTQLNELTYQAGDLIVSNIPIDSSPLPVFYLSLIPTKNELSRLTELTNHSYI